MSARVVMAAIQLDARPAPPSERLERAEALVAEAARQGARLVVLPEVFNTGYEYAETNYARAEPLTGPTAAWLTKTAGRLGVHLAGSFLLRAADDIFNSMLIVAPDGRYWRYDKNYPWVWEHAYFRPGRGFTVAETELGRLGMLICWDVAHPDLWARYAGRVQAMIVGSCPPAMHKLQFALPDGRRIGLADTGTPLRWAMRGADEIFGEFLLRQSVNLGVPLVNAGATGQFVSGVPRPRLSLSFYFALRTEMWRYLSLAHKVRLTAGYISATLIADSAGNVLASVGPGSEGVALAEVSLPDVPPQPGGPPPSFGMPRMAYWLDKFANAALAGEYRRKSTAAG